jgi:Ca2+-dependent lipid-binding protein
LAVVKKNLNPVWREFSASSGVLCGGDLDRTLKIDVYDWDDNSAPDLVTFSDSLLFSQLLIFAVV